MKADSPVAAGGDQSLQLGKSIPAWAWVCQQTTNEDAWASFDDRCHIAVIEQMRIGRLYDERSGHIVLLHCMSNTVNEA